MGLKFGRLAIPNHLETLDRMSLDVSIQTIEGGIPQWPGGGGIISVDFVVNPGPVAHSGYGAISLRDGSGTTILSVTNALIQVEEGPKDGVWRTLASFSATGNDIAGVPYAFKNGEQNPLDTTSLIVDFALAASAKPSDAHALKVWSGQVQPIAGDGLPRPVVAWLEAEGIAVDAFEAFIRGLGAKIDAPESWVDQAVGWLEANAKWGADKIAAFLALAVIEIKSGRSGYNKDSVGLA